MSASVNKISLDICCVTGCVSICLPHTKGESVFIAPVFQPLWCYKEQVSTPFLRLYAPWATFCFPSATRWDTLLHFPTLYFLRTLVALDTRGCSAVHWEDRIWVNIWTQLVRMSNVEFFTLILQDCSHRISFPNGPCSIDQQWNTVIPHTSSGDTQSNHTLAADPTAGQILIKPSEQPHIGGTHIIPLIAWGNWGQIC